MTTVLVNGATRPLGRRVVDLVRSDPSVRDVIAVESGSRGEPAAGLRVLTAVELAGDPWRGLDGPLDVVILAPLEGPDRDGSTMGGVDLGIATELLDSLRAVDVRRLVLLSSAMVYGAWPDNPVPLTEEAVLRPNPGCRYAADKAELERLGAEWSRAGNSIPPPEVVVLRPVVTVFADPGAVDWMERSLWHTPTARPGDFDPKAQFLHLDDLAHAIEHARRFGPTGVLNVAPDGWMTTERQVELTGRGALLRVPAAIARWVAALRWRWGGTSTPPDIVAYTLHPWVVANDRLRGAGWEPSYSNDEAFIVANREGWWASLNARRRQDVALGVLVGGMAAAVGGVVALVRALRHR
ncbi:MAG: NAD-dependent epimerase/dehydratase family protein [Microthrixaceae bacterium]|nr:NAD-dependent epimerase/dehydratase family protein [Microthrixaceae bacterium]